MLGVPSITKPWCISSVYKVVQPACNAAATIRLSYHYSWYFSLINNALLIVATFKNLITQLCSKNLQWATISIILK